MPLVAFSVGAYLAGLLGGFTSHLGLVLVLSATAAAIGLARDRVDLLLLSALAAAGSLTANGVSRGDEHCQADVRTRTSLDVQLRDSAAPGSYVGATSL